VPEAGDSRLVKSVKVHDDTHRVLKELKIRTRGRSIDEVIRGMIRTATGASVERFVGKKSAQLTSYMEVEKQK